MKKLLTAPAAGTLVDILGEGGESALTTYLTPYFKRAFYDKDAKNATPGEIAGNAAISITASLLLHFAAALPSYFEDDFPSSQTMQKRLADSGKDEYDLNSDLEPGPFPEDDFEDFNSDLRGYAEDSGIVVNHPGANRTVTEGAGDAWYKADGSLNMPPNYGAVAGTEKIIDLQPGSKLERFGTYGKSSDFLTAPGSPAESLSLPPYTDTSIYQEFNVLKPIPGVTQSTVAPWGGSVGGGMQYRLPMTIEDLLLNGYIRK